MQKIRHTLMLLSCLAVGWLGCEDVHAGDPRLQAISSDPATLRIAQEAGRKASFFCVNCHGDNGVSRLPDVPNLAGQNADYVLEQTRKFGSGQRKDPFMQGLIKALKEEEKIQISLFYASQNPRPMKTDPVKAAAGRQVFVKYCARCHGNQGYGNETIPRLAGQHQEYVIMSVTRYRDRTGERQDPLMFSAVAPLKDSEIQEVAAYLSTMP
ncbi:MAG: c-type cytochrome [Zoogloeaceae bacterium]|jgi:cytochrome c553|nr:c-type cytochrome [Zoogloeaceae bacterium]